MEYFIGMDAHSKTSTFVVLDKEGQVLHRQRVITTEREMLGFVRAFKKNETHLAFEEVPLAQWLFGLLKDEVQELVICSPAHLPKKRGPKDDFRDALEIADLLRCNRLTPVYHDVSPFMAMRTLTAGYQDLVNIIVATKNRMNALVRRQGKRVVSRTEYLKEDIVTKVEDPWAQFVLKDLYNQVVLLEDQKKAYKKMFEENRKRFPEIRLLMSIPGIGIIFANQLLATIVTSDRFANKYKFFSYCRLVKYHDVSDGVIYGRRSSFGRKDLKAIFKTAALVSISGNGGMRDYYEQLLKEGKSTKAAWNSVSRKIASLVLTVLKKRKPFSKNRFDKELAKRKEQTVLEKSA